MKFLVSIFLMLLSAFPLIPLYAKPIIDLRDINLAAILPSYERANFIFCTQGKNSHVVVVTDVCLPQVDGLRAQGYEKIIAYLIEPKIIYPYSYQFVKDNVDKFDLILTFDKELLDLYPNKCKFIHALGRGTLQTPGLHKKSKMCSIMTGNNITEGHILRLKVLERYKKYFDSYKTFESPYSQYKDPWHNDFYFAVIIENSRAAHYFSEKITDCFQTGTVPIYWGCPTIGEFFDIDGIIVFDSLDDLEPILENLSVEEYNKRLPAIRRNFEIAAKYPEFNFVMRPEYPDSVETALWPYVKEFFSE